ncbi:MAG: RNA methyltransferase [Bacteroidales bacterium]|nr:RNA methyltransferase [Bacteroidales bacterium]
MMYRKLLNSELGRPDLEQYRGIEKEAVAVVLDNVRSQHNIGSAFRTSDAFRVSKLLLCGISATPPSPEIHKSALGAEFSVEWEHYDDTLEALKALRAEGYTLVAIEQAENSLPLKDFATRVLESGEKVALVFGNEVKGVGQQAVDMCDLCVEIPQWGTKHSLNVSVTVGIVLYSISRLVF